MKYLHNFRDAGGLTLPAGAVREGVLFRSAAPMRRVDAVDAQMRELGMEVVIDLRDDGERAVSSPSWREAGAEVHTLPIFENTLRQIRFDTLDELYAVMLASHAGALARAFSRLAASAGRPTLVHCTAGKDRTGVLIALVHEVLGVPRREVLAHFALSQERLGAEYLADLFRDVAAEDLPGAAAHRAVAAPPELLDGLLRALDRDFGGAEGFLLANGVDPGLLARLRRELGADELAVSGGRR